MMVKGDGVRRSAGFCGKLMNKSSCFSCSLVSSVLLLEYVLHDLL
jgi:hypothetical protein